jgi:uncharacterized protein YcbX
MLTVSALHIYPIKSCRGLDLTAVRLDRLGPLYDRRFMLVDDDGRFLTQRQLPRMALITPKLGPTTLQVSAPEMPVLKVAMSQAGAKRIAIEIWKQHGQAEDVGEHASSWFSQFLERRCRLVRLPADAGRPVDPAYAGADAHVAFSDGFPLLLTTEASLADLNGRLERALPMNRFRPNIVVRGGEPYAEDRWKRIRAGEVSLELCKPCARCAITTVDQITAQQGTEPLATLAQYRKRDNKVIFGQNCLHSELGAIRVGDPVEVIEEHPS